MIYYSDELGKRIKKKNLPENIFIHFDNAFQALMLTKDFNLFDIKKIKGVESERNYYRLRKGKYRAIFYMEEENIYVITIDKREEVYKKWA